MNTLLNEARKELVDWITDEFGNSVCTDYIYLTIEQERELLKIFRDSTEQKNRCPADLFYANTIPLTDINIQVLNENNVSYRIKVISNYQECIESLCEAPDLIECVPIAFCDVFFKDVNKHLYGSMALTSGDLDYITPSIMRVNEDTESILKNKDAETQMYSCLTFAYLLWYMTQICLLNPVTKVIFSKPVFRKLHGNDKVKVQKIDKTIKYVKHYYIKDEDIENALYGGDRSFHRKCLVWYVTGHWREYKSGKKIFIKGFWKGKLRNTPPKTTEPRNRELVINESEVKHELSDI